MNATFAIGLHRNYTYFCTLMKHLSGILSLYLLVIALLPCVDEGFSSEELLGQQSELIDSEHEHDESTKDHCSPFCACSCCQITIRPPASFSMFLGYPPMLGREIPQMYSHLHGLIDVDKIWQPPRLS